MTFLKFLAFFRIHFDDFLIYFWQGSKILFNILKRGQGRAQRGCRPDHSVLFRVFGILLGSSRTILDGFWIKTDKSIKCENICVSTGLGTTSKVLKMLSDFSIVLEFVWKILIIHIYSGHTRKSCLGIAPGAAPTAVLTHRLTRDSKD